MSDLTSCDLLDYSPPGSSVPGIFQARILEWIAISSSRGSSGSRDQTRVSTSPALAGGLFPSSANLGLPTSSLNSLQTTSPLGQLCPGASPVAQWSRIFLPMQETQVWCLGLEYPLEKEMATRSSILAPGYPMDRGAWAATELWSCRAGNSNSCVPLVMISRGC